MTRTHVSRASERGQALVEIALCVPLLMLFLIGAIDLGRLSQFDTTLESAARAGAQYGSLNLVTANDGTGMTTAAQNDLPSWASNFTVSPSSYCQCPGGAAASCTATACSTSHRLLYVSVSVTGTFRPFFHYFTGTAVARTRTATLQVGQ